MKHLILLIVQILCIMIPQRLFADVRPLNVEAYDFSVDGLCYKIIPDATNEVKLIYEKGTVVEDYPGDIDHYSYKKWEFTNTCKGDVVIPETVTDKGVTYRVTQISDFAFCKGIYGIYYGREPFDGFSPGSSTDITSITLPGTIKSIGRFAFAGNAAIKSFSIPESVTVIDDAAFQSCTGLSKLIIEDGMEELDFKRYVEYFDGMYYNVPSHHFKDVSIEELYMGRTSNSSFKGSTSLKKLAFGPQVIKLEDDLFCNCDGLTEVSIPDGIQEMGATFQDCDGLTRIDIPGSMRKMGATFQKCKGLTEVNIQEGIQEMEATFQNCDGLTSVKLPASLRSLRQAFSDCPNLESAELQEGVEILDQTFCRCGKLKNINVPSTVTSMNGTFQECMSLTEAYLPENVTSSRGAYLNCNSVGKITIRNKIIGDFAFCNCNKTNELEIPDGVVSIGNSAFYGVPGPKTLTIPGSVTHIGATALNQNVEEITFECGEEPLEYNEGSWSSDWNLQKLKHLILNRNIVLTSYSPFSNPSKLTQVEFGDRVTSIPNGLFAGCTGITRLNLPAQMESIGSEAFAGCTGITWLTLPAQMQSIGSKAFSGCTGIKGITSYTEDPYPIEDDTFDQNAYDFTPIYVPQGTDDRYRRRRGWKNFYYINEIGPDGVKGIEASDPKTKTPILYDLQGRRLQQKPTKGIYIQNGKKVLSK